MKRIPVQSSNVLSVGYEIRDRILEVEFKGGAVYQYFEVPATTYGGLMSAPSIGAFIAAHIKGKYQCRKLEPVAAADGG